LTTLVGKFHIGTALHPVAAQQERVAAFAARIGKAR
jgi:hypothetical protein